MAEKQQSNSGATWIGVKQHTADFVTNRDVNLMREGSAAQRSDEDILSKSVERLNAKKAAIAAEVRAPTRRLQAFAEAKSIVMNEYNDRFDNGLAKIISERKMFDGSTFVNGKQYVSKNKATLMAKVKMSVDKQTLDLERQYVANAYASVIPDENGNYARPDTINVGFVKSFNILAQQMTEDELEEWFCRIDAFSKSRDELDRETGKTYEEVTKEVEGRNASGERIKDVENYLAYQYRIAYRLEDGTFFSGSEQDLADLLYCDALRLDFKSLAGIEKATQIMTAAKFLSHENQEKIKSVVARQLRFANEASPEQNASADTKKSFVKAKLAELGIDADAPENAALHAELLVALGGSTMGRSEWDGYVEKMANTYNLRKQMALDAKDFSLRISGLGAQKGEVDKAYDWSGADFREHQRIRGERLKEIHTVEGFFKDFWKDMKAQYRFDRGSFYRAGNWISENIGKYIFEEDDTAK